MRVAMISYHTCPLATLGGKDTGGMNVYVRDLTRLLGRRGIGVDVFTRSQDEHVPHVLHDLGYGNRIVHVRAGPEVPVEKKRLADHLPEFVTGIERFASSKNLRYDLIHAHYWLSGLAALELRDRWSLPIIQMFHTLAEMKNRVARSENESASDLRLRSEKHLMQSVERLIVSTPAELAQIQWLYRVDTSRVVVIPPGVDSSRFYPIQADEAKEYIGIREERRIILFVGRIEPLKGIDTLLEAVRLLRTNPEADFADQLRVLVIGGDPGADPETMSGEMRRLLDLCRELEVEDLVRFLGQRDQDILPYYYSAADVVVVPSHYESFGLVALEAMACGTPVVASETGGLVYLVRDGETGFHIPAAQPQALADRLQQLLEDEALRSKLGAQASAYARGYAWSEMVNKILDVYSELLGRAA